jgi:hypothetical protein
MPAFFCPFIGLILRLNKGRIAILEVSTGQAIEKLPTSRGIPGYL